MQNVSVSQANTVATILELSRLVCSSLELEVVFERMLAAVRDLSGADLVSIMLLDDSRQQLRIVAAHGLAPELLGSYHLRVGEGVAGWVALHGMPVHLVDPARDPRYAAIVALHQACLCALPLRVRDRTLGVINLARSEVAELFSSSTVQTVEIFASHAAIAIENAATATALRYAATREQLTGLVHQAPRAVGVASQVADQLVAHLGLALEATVYAVTVSPGLPATQGQLLASWPSDTLLETWCEAAGEELNSGSDTGGMLQIDINVAGAGAGWLCVHSAREDRYWSRAERELVRFAGEQIGLLLLNEQLAAQEQRSRALSQTFSQLTAACNAMVGQVTLLDFILEQLARFLDYDSSGVFLFQDDTYVRMVAGRGFHFNSADVVLYTGPGSLPWILRQERRATYVPDVQLIPGWQNVPDSDIIRAWIGVPLVVHDTLIGIVTIDKWEPNAFDAADVEVAQLFADHVAVAINNQRLLREAELRANQLQLLHQLSVHLSTVGDQARLLDEMARLLHATFGYYQVLVGTLKDEKIVLQAAYGAINNVQDFFHPDGYSVNYGLTGWVARTGETLLVNNVLADERYFFHPQLSETAAELVVPIRRDGRVLGIISVGSKMMGAFNQSDADLVEAVASQTAMALESLSHNIELRRTQEQLAHSERLRSLGELASGVAHDFNNLLTSILGHTQLLLSEYPKTEMAEELQIIERAALDGAATVRRLQSFAQTSRSLPAEAVELSEIIDESLAITRPRWRDALQSWGFQITIVREIEALPAFAGDGPGLRELVTNLVLNAVDAMPQGGTLHLRARPVASEHSPLRQPSALLEVSDSGVGMSPEVRDRIFDPFFTTKGPRGTGMGLAMAYGIVQRHQGQISVQSEPGRGSTFTVFLPARAVAPVLKDPVLTLASYTQPLRMLAVDDDDAVRRVLVRQLRRLGHNVVEVSSGEAALAALDKEQFELLCTDLGMPGISGWELIARARLLHPTLITLLITGWGEQIDEASARAGGIDFVLSKPFHIEQLRQALDRLQPLRNPDSLANEHEH